MTPAEAARKEFPDPDPLDYGKNDEGATLYNHACIATELRREGYLKRMEQENRVSVEGIMEVVKEWGFDSFVPAFEGPRNSVFLKGGAEEVLSARLTKLLSPAALTPDPNG